MLPSTTAISIADKAVSTFNGKVRPVGCRWLCRGGLGLSLSAALDVLNPTGPLTGRGLVCVGSVHSAQLSFYFTRSCAVAVAAQSIQYDATTNTYQA